MLKICFINELFPLKEYTVHIKTIFLKIVWMEAYEYSASVRIQRETKKNTLDVSTERTYTALTKQMLKVEKVKY